jgi:hypothetical protein
VNASGCRFRQDLRNEVIGLYASRALDRTSLFNFAEAHITPEMGDCSEMNSNFVLVLDTERQPLSPCHPARARELLKNGKAAVLRHYPFTIILKRAIPDANPVIAPGRRSITPSALMRGNGKKAGSRRPSNIALRPR